MGDMKPEVSNLLGRLTTLVFETSTSLCLLVKNSTEKAAAVFNETDVTELGKKYSAYVSERNDEIDHILLINRILGSLIKNQNVSPTEENKKPTKLTTLNANLEPPLDHEACPVSVEAAPPIKACNQKTPSPVSTLIPSGTGDTSENFDKSYYPPDSVDAQIQGNNSPAFEDSTPRSSVNDSSLRTLQEKTLVPPFIGCSFTALEDTTGKPKIKTPVDILPGSKGNEVVSDNISSSRPQTNPSKLSPEVDESLASSMLLPSTKESVSQESEQVISGRLHDKAQKTHAKQAMQIRVESSRIQSQKSQPSSSDCEQLCNTSETQTLVTKTTPNRESVCNKFGASNTIQFHAQSGHPKNGSFIPGDITANAASLQKFGSASTPTSKFPDTLLSLLADSNDWCGLVAHVISPSEFYFHVSGAGNEKIDEFHEKLNNFYQNYGVLPFECKRAVQEMVGNFCVCYLYSDPSTALDSGWYRTQVLDWNSNVKDEVTVQLVDYGNKCTAKFSDIRPLSEEFSKRPLFATRCHLSYLRPPQSLQEWPSATTSILKSYLELEAIEKVYTISPTGKEVIPPFSSLPGPHLNHDKSVPVILLSDDNLGSVNDYLIDIDFAEFDTKMEVDQLEMMESNFKESLRLKELDESRRRVEEWCTEDQVKRNDRDKQYKKGRNQKGTEEKPKRPPSPDFQLGAYLPKPKVETPPPNEMDEWDPMQEDYENAEMNDEDACVAVFGYAPTDETRICRFFAANGWCPWDTRCRREHVLSNIHGITTDTEEVFDSAFNEQPMYMNGQTLFLTLTSGQGGFFYAIELRFQSLLERLCDAMNDPASVAAYKRLKVAPALSQIVLAKFSQDGRFYRARAIDGVDGEMRVLVYYVDFGHWELVPEKDLREIRPEFLHLPFQSIKCSLSNVKLFKEMFDQAGKFLSSEYVSPKFLQAEVVSSDASTLYVLATDEKNRDVGEVLVQKGFGTFEDLNNIIHLSTIPGSNRPG